LYQRDPKTTEKEKRKSDPIQPNHLGPGGGLNNGGGGGDGAGIKKRKFPGQRVWNGGGNLWTGRGSLK